MAKPFIKHMEEVGIKDVAEVGGKNASLGEMIQKLEPKGVKIPGGFVITAYAYRYFLKKAEIPAFAKASAGKAKSKKTGKISLEKFIRQELKGLNTKNLDDLEARGRIVREAIKSAKFPKDLEKEIVKGYVAMEKKYGKNTDVAVRSSATAEDLPGASFAGEHETYLNIRGKDEVLEAAKSSMASLFTARAISYRVDKHFDHFKVALSVGVQKMVRSDIGCSGVMFSLDTESGFKDLIIVNGSWGLGEMIVQGEVTPDEFLVFKGKLFDENFKPLISKKLGVKNRKMIYAKGGGIKRTKIIATSQKEKETFVLSEPEILKLARWGQLVEDHYTKKHGKWTPMDMEWAKDGKTKEMFMVQARPETIHAGRDYSKIKEYIREENGKLIVKGASVSSKIASGKARVILDAKNIHDFQAGEVLVTDMTDPDWEPIMKIASAIVTDKGGRTSHAAIVSRELGIPCVVGSETATKKIKTGDMLTVDTTGSEGLVFAGSLKFKIVEHNAKKIPKTKTKITMNIATPDTAFEKSFLPNSGVGLAREEFIIASDIGIHPLAMLNYKNLKDVKLKKEIDVKTKGWKDKPQFYVDKLAYGIAKIGAAFYPKQVIVRFSDFKTNEYRTLIGGGLYEPEEENPMIGWRGASRYYNPAFAPAFILEIKAIKKVREEMGLDNVQVMVPFCRTVEEGKKVVDIIHKNGLKPDSGIKIYVMCEIPSDVILADEFLKIFDGMSIGSNDLTQLTVGIDRDGGGLIRGITNERDESVKILIEQAIKKCKEHKKYIGICGDAPSTFPEFAKFLVEKGIESMSLNPDVVVKTTIAVHEMEKSLRNKK
ncbi:MAG: phosphoenolpyruvate synthase [Candidatus Wolfebacteria bacterium]|nr:phosphoenolpyruvate synthase [Candidatus Wolfebacteria bacterium]